MKLIGLFAANQAELEQAEALDLPNPPEVEDDWVTVDIDLDRVETFWVTPDTGNINFEMYSGNRWTVKPDKRALDYLQQKFRP